MIFNEIAKQTFKFLMITGRGADSAEPLPFGSPKHFQQFAATGRDCKGSTVSIFTLATKHTAVSDAESDAEFLCRSAFYS